MSDPGSSAVEDREKRKAKEKKEEKKRRKAEKRRLSQGLIQEQFNSSSSKRSVQETAEEEKARRKKEKKEAKRMRRHKEASAAGQIRVDRPVKEIRTIPLPDKAIEDDTTKEKENRKRKERPVEDTNSSEAVDGSGVNPEMSDKVLDNPVQIDVAQSYLHSANKEVDQAKPRKKKKAKRDTAAIETKNSKSEDFKKSREMANTEHNVEKKRRQKEKRRKKSKGLQDIEKGKSKEDVLASSPEKSIEVDSNVAVENAAISTNAVEGTSGGRKTHSDLSRPKINVQDRIDQIISKGSRSNPQAGSTNRVGRSNSGNTSMRSSGSLPLSTKDGVLEDAQHLSHKEMLVDRLYHSQQLKWLQEDRQLKIKTGKFSDWEKGRIQNAIEAFKKEQTMSDEDFTTWLFASKEGKEEKDLYSEFWRGVTASLEDRPNRAVRIAVRRSLQSNTMQGAWTNVESTKLKSAVQANGQNWSAVARAVGSRSAEDCRLRWRDFDPTLFEARKQGKYDEEDEKRLIAAVRKVCEKAGVDPMSPNSKISWKLVSREIDGQRTPSHCLTKWQSMLNDIGQEEESLKWTLNDSKIFLLRLSKEREALERDDFTEVKLASLRSHDWLMDPNRLLTRWKSFVAEYVSPTADFKTNFRANLKTITDAITSSNDESYKGRKRRKSTQAQEDLIESDEEV